jgi:hypothetical protein
MSKRRNAGDIVKKQAGAGFVGESSLVFLPEINPEDLEPCFLCDDEDCQEWPTVYQCDAAGKLLGGVACHVSECQMGDA